MPIELTKLLPTPEKIRTLHPVPPKLIELKAKRDAEIRNVITGQSRKFLVIIGPCSADNEDAVCDYVSRLAEVNEKVKDRLILIPRIYTNKPRTTGEGYKGIVHQPNPEQKADFLTGLIAMRKMHIRAIEESGLTAADEMLYPDNWGYVSDILSYVAIGARSVEDQQHRIVASGFDEKPHQRKFNRYAKLRICCPASSFLYLQRMGIQNKRKRPGSHGSAGRHQQARRESSQLPL